MIEKIMMWSFMGISAWQDYHNKKISALIFLLFGTGGLICCFAKWEPGFLINLLASCLIGGGLFLIHHLTRGGIGMGDVLFFMISGLYLSWQRNVLLLVLGVSLSSIYSACLVVKHFSCYQKIKKMTIPFLPFLLLPGLWVICQ